MRFFRGFVASAGASVCLIAAASLSLFSVSTVVAFSGWPGLSPSAEPMAFRAVLATEPTARDPAARTKAPARAAGTPQAIVLASAPAAPRRAPGARRPDRGRAATPPRETAASRPDLATTTRPASGTAPADPSAPPVPAPSRPGSVAGDAVRDVTGDVGDTVTGVTGGTAKTLEPVSPGAAKTVDDVGRALDGTLRGVGRGAGAAVDRLLGGG